MFSDFPQTLRRYGIDADVRVIMDIYQTMENESMRVHYYFRFNQQARKREN